ncbi:MAG TPA: hypothetical protein VGV87_12190 [Blastocatellia bacterium]|jgi:hypothetical protein|nr:hypothetical protein [Blastocatellia bacterium]
MTPGIKKFAFPVLGVVAFGALALCVPVSAQEKKLTAEELVSRHLDAIGSKEARAAVTRRVVSGPVKYVIRVAGGGFLNGGAVMLSSGPKFRYTMKFANPEYPSDDLAFDGERADTSILPNGRRTSVGLFLTQQSLPLKEGLLGGVLSTAWALGRTGQLQPRIEYRGIKKIEGRELYSLGYRARKGSSDLKVNLYFDAGSFRHVRTEYTFEMAAGLGAGGPNDSSRNEETHFLLVEEFDDFRAVDGLTLPHKYKLQVDVSGVGSSFGGGRPVLRDWTLTVDQISHKAAVDESVFKIR